jgi:hypothetical protein
MLLIAKRSNGWIFMEVVINICILVEFFSWDWLTNLKALTQGHGRLTTNVCSCLLLLDFLSNLTLIIISVYCFSDLVKELSSDILKALINCCSKSNWWYTGSLHLKFCTLIFT